MKLRFVDLNEDLEIDKLEVKFKDLNNLTEEIEVNNIQEEIKVYLNPKDYIPDSRFREELLNKYDSNEAIMYLESIGPFYSRTIIEDNYQNPFECIISFGLIGNDDLLDNTYKPALYNIYIYFRINADTTEFINKVLDRLETSISTLLLGKTVFAKIKEGGELYQNIKRKYNLYKYAFHK